MKDKIKKNKIFKTNIFLLSILIILFSLSCDETEPTSQTDPTINYTITIDSQVKNCNSLSCINDTDAEAYSYNVDNPSNNDYHLYFQIQLTGANNTAISDAELIIKECPTSENECTTNITDSEIAYFSETTTTNSEGILEGYWKDNGETGEFLITVEYVDQYSNTISEAYNIYMRPLSEIVDYLTVIPSTDTLFVDAEDTNTDTTYVINITATLKDNNVNVENVPIHFNVLNQAPGNIDNSTATSDSSGATVSLSIAENEIIKKDSLVIRTSVFDPDTEDSERIADTTSVYFYTEAYYQKESGKDLYQYAVTDEEIEDNTSVTYITTLYAEVLNKFGAKMANVPVRFDRVTEGLGSLDNSLAWTDSLGNAASVNFTLNSTAFGNLDPDGEVEVQFDISLLDSDQLPEGHPLYEPEQRTITYQLNGYLEPEFDVADFDYYPSIPAGQFLPHQQHSSTYISVVAKNDDGVGISNVHVQFSLVKADGEEEEYLDITEEEYGYESHGMISDEIIYTCCDDAQNEESDEESSDTTGGGGDDGDGDGGCGAESNQLDGIACLSYTNLEGGIDKLYAYILDPYTSDILTNQFGVQIGLDSLTIITNEACGGDDCGEALDLYAGVYDLPNSETGLEQTNIYAFYKDTLGQSPEVYTYVNLKAQQEDADGDWINVGSISPEDSRFEYGTVADINENLFLNAPEDSVIIFAHATFNMEGSSGLVSIIGEYEGSQDTLGIQVNSTGASFVEIIAPYPSQIAVQGSPDLESTTVVAEIRDGNGNLVTDCYTTKFELASAAVLAGVHFNGVQDLTEYYTYSSNGSSSVTLNSGTLPVSVGMTVTVYDGCAEIPENADDDYWENLYICEASAVPVTCASGPPTSAQIGYAFSDAIPIGGGMYEMPVSILVWDSWANPVADSISVYFTTEPQSYGSIVAEAKTGNLKPGGTPDDHWPGLAWTTIEYNSEQLSEFGEIIATTTGNICVQESYTELECDLYDDPNNGFDTKWLPMDNLDNGGMCALVDLTNPEACDIEDYSCAENEYECDQISGSGFGYDPNMNSLHWGVDLPILFSSVENTTSYQNVCAECAVGLQSFGSTQYDFGCYDVPFVTQFAAGLTDAYDIPVDGARLALAPSGTQGPVSWIAIEDLDAMYGCCTETGLVDGDCMDGTDVTEGVDYSNPAFCYEDQVFGCFHDLNPGALYDAPEEDDTDGLWDAGEDWLITDIELEGTCEQYDDIDICFNNLGAELEELTTQSICEVDTVACFIEYDYTGLADFDGEYDNFYDHCDDELEQDGCEMLPDCQWEIYESHCYGSDDIYDGISLCYSGVDPDVDEDVCSNADWETLQTSCELMESLYGCFDSTLEFLESIENEETCLMDDYGCFIDFDGDGIWDEGPPAPLDGIGESDCPIVSSSYCFDDSNLDGTYTYNEFVNSEASDEDECNALNFCFNDLDDNGVYDEDLGEDLPDGISNEDDCNLLNVEGCFDDSNQNGVWDGCVNTALDGTCVGESELDIDQGMCETLSGNEAFEDYTWGPVANYMWSDGGFNYIWGDIFYEWGIVLENTNSWLEVAKYTWGTTVETSYSFNSGNYQWGVIVPSQNTWGLISEEDTNEDDETWMPWDNITFVTDEAGFKYWEITFTAAECTQTGFGDGQQVFTCSTPEITSWLVDPIRVQSDAISLTLTKTCP